jgi:hypothetical protein
VKPTPHLQEQHFTKFAIKVLCDRILAVVVLSWADDVGHAPCWQRTAPAWKHAQNAIKYNDAKRRFKIRISLKFQDDRGSHVLDSWRRPVRLLVRGACLHFLSWELPGMWCILTLPKYCLRARGGDLLPPLCCCLACQYLIGRMVHAHVSTTVDVYARNFTTTNLREILAPYPCDRELQSLHFPLRATNAWIPVPRTTAVGPFQVSFCLFFWH